MEQINIRKFLNFPPSTWFIGRGWLQAGLHYHHSFFVELRSLGFVVTPCGRRGFYVKYNHAPHVGRLFAEMYFEGRLRDRLGFEKLQGAGRRRLDPTGRNPCLEEIWIRRALETPDAAGWFPYFLVVFAILILLVIGFAYYYYVLATVLA